MEDIKTVILTTIGRVTYLLPNLTKELLFNFGSSKAASKEAILFLLTDIGDKAPKNLSNDIKGGHMTV